MQPCVSLANPPPPVQKSYVHDPWALGHIPPTKSAVSPWRALDDGRGEVAVAAHGAHATDQGRHEAAASAAAPVALPALLPGFAGFAGRPWPSRIPGFTL